jgi:hypothetical protein
MEDETYDDINDNYQYLSTSALAHPELPLDFASQDAGTSYGSWVFWRFLTEYLGSAGVENASIIKQVWDRADGSSVGPDDYSLQAVSHVLSSNGSSLKNAFADYGALNFFPEAFYEEGQAYLDFLDTNGLLQGGRPPHAEVTLTKSRPSASGTFRIDHLSNVYGVHFPGKGVTSSAKLKITIDAPPSKRGPEATAEILSASGQLTLKAISLDADGNGSKKVSFGNATAVIVVLTNASGRFSCFQNPPLPLSCAGLPKDDQLKYSLKTKVIQ